MLTEEEMAQIDTPLECQDAQDCARLWRAAQVWIVQNAGYKLQVATDAVLQTYNPPNYSSRWGFEVLRQPVGGTRERITVYATCGQAPICSETPNQMRAKFFRAMRTAR